MIALKIQVVQNASQMEDVSASIDEVEGTTLPEIRR